MSAVAASTTWHWVSVVQHLEGGIVSEILVTDGQLVEQGQPLLILDNTQSKAELGILMGQYYTTRAMERRLVAERDLSGVVEFPVTLNVEDARAREAIRNEELIFSARRRNGSGRVIISPAGCPTSSVTCLNLP